MPTFVNYCVYVLPISRYSGVPWVVPTNTGIFKTMLRKKTLASAFGTSKMKIGAMHFSEIIKLQFEKKNAMLLHCFVFLIISKKCVVTPNFLSEFLLFPHSHKPCKNTLVLVVTNEEHLVSMQSAGVMFAQAPITLDSPGAQHTFLLNIRELPIILC